MESLKGITKKGWHPEQEGKGIRATIKKAVGRDKDDVKYTSYSTPYERKDPSLFPPPPKTKRYEPGESVVAASKPETSSYKVESPITDVDEGRIDGPFKADNTGKDISKYPKPPPRTGTQSQPVVPVAGPPPSLPPRLPPRETASPTSPTASDGFLNQGAISRLGKSGISVPGFNIGSSSQPTSTSTSSTSVPTTGTSWAEKKAALKTASNIRKDPSSVTFKDIKSAAATARNFRDRHGEQVASGLRSASQLNQKYGITDRISSMSISQSSVDSSPQSPSQSLPQSPPQSPPKKTPPPPPPKKSHLQSLELRPPPVPLHSKPQG